MRIILSLALLAIVLLVIGGCTSVQKDITITSTPSGAKVYATPDTTGATAQFIGETPFDYKFRFDKNPKVGPFNYSLVFRKAEYIDTPRNIGIDFKPTTFDVTLDHTVSNAISIVSTPSGASVRATADKEGPKDFLIGTAPVTYTFIFDTRPDAGPHMFNLEFSLSGYDPCTITIQKEDTKPITVSLTKTLVKEIEKLVLVVTPDDYKLVVRKVRAWVEDIEREGREASSVLRFGGNQYPLGLTISPDGSTLYFAVAETIKDAQGQDKSMANLRAVSTSGGGITQVTSGLWLDANPSCSGDGKYLFFSSNRMQLDRADIFRLATDKSSGIAVIRQTVEGLSYHPSVSTDGTISYAYKPRYNLSGTETEHIWTVGGSSGYPTQLKEGSMPAISPDGKEIAYIGKDGQLWKMPVTSQNPIQLTGDAVNLEGKKNPTWSPDGEYILFASDVGKDSRNFANYDLWIISNSGGMATQLTTNGSEDDYPVVSPDQKYIYFTSNRGVKYGIWRIPYPTMTSSKKQPQTAAPTDAKETK
jgi:Tol biopolymer transport system component